MSNYESYLLDYQYGKLSCNEIKQLRDFVLCQGLDWETLTETLPQLEAPEVRFKDKESLLQAEIIPVGAVNENNYERYFTAYHEGDLDEEEQRQVLGFVRINPSLSDDFKLFGWTRLQPNADEVFQGKALLKKESRIVPLFGKMAAVAAAIALLLVIFWKRDDTLPQQEMVAELKPIAASQIEAKTSATAIPVNRTYSIDKQISNEKVRSETLVSERLEAPLLATLQPVTAQELTFSDDYLIAHNLAPDLHFYYWDVEYAFAEPLTESDFEEEEEAGSLIDRGISQISNGRYGSLGELLGKGMHRATRQVIKTSAKVVFTAYCKTDYRIEEAKEKWQEKWNRKEE